MNQFEEKYKKYNENIKPSTKLDEKILNKTIYNKKNIILKKSIIAIRGIILLSLISISIAYANEIKEIIKKNFMTSVKITNEKGEEKESDKVFFKVHNLKELNFDADLEEIKYDPLNTNRKVISREEIEQKLDIKFLKSNLFESKNFEICSIEKVNNKIASGKLLEKEISLVNITNSNQTFINIEIDFITKYTELYKNGISFKIAPLDTNEWIFTEHNEHLNVDINYRVGVPKSKKDPDRITFVKAIFVYDDVVYHIDGNRISKNMMTDIINTLDY